MSRIDARHRPNRWYWLPLSALIASAASCRPANTQTGDNHALPWPPRVGESFPELQLRDVYGAPVSLGDLRGQLLLIEPIGMDCPACQAFAGAAEHGPFGPVTPQPDLPAFEQILAGRGVNLGGSQVHWVQLLLYNARRDGPPSLEEAQRWARHFELDRRSDVRVLVGDDALINPASYRMIPGFFLVDQCFVVRSDLTGHRPANSWDHFFENLMALRTSPPTCSPDR